MYTSVMIFKKHQRRVMNRLQKEMNYFIWQTSVRYNKVSFQKILEPSHGALQYNTYVIKEELL